jgi:adenylate kinase
MNIDSTRIVLLGKPGSGKGTQASLLAEHLGAAHLSSGEILRSEIRASTPLGRRVSEYVERGEIGPEELIAGAIISYIDKNSLGDSYILDGFPRTLYQALELDKAFPPYVSILISLSDTIIKERISRRLSCQQCGAVYNIDTNPPAKEGVCSRCGSPVMTRQDDSEEAIAARLDVFDRQVTPVISYYRDSKRIVEIDGALPPDEVFSGILNALRPG